jgi:hypothetical protein
LDRGPGAAMHDPGEPARRLARAAATGRSEPAVLTLPARGLLRFTHADVGFRSGAAHLPAIHVDRFGPVTDRLRLVRTDAVGNRLATARRKCRLVGGVVS